MKKAAPLAVDSLDYMTDALNGLNVRPHNYLCVEKKPAPLTYRVIVSTQMMERYGNRWKCKSGHDYIVAEGLSEFDFLTRSPVEFIPPGIEWRGETAEVSILDVYFSPSNHPTYEERMIGDFAEWEQPMSLDDIASLIKETRRYLK